MTVGVPIDDLLAEPDKDWGSKYSVCACVWQLFIVVYWVTLDDLMIFVRRSSFAVERIWRASAWHTATPRCRNKALRRASAASSVSRVRSARHFVSLSTFWHRRGL